MAAGGQKRRARRLETGRSERKSQVPRLERVGALLEARLREPEALFALLDELAVELNDVELELYELDQLLDELDRELNGVDLEQVDLDLELVDLDLELVGLDLELVGLDLELVDLDPELVGLDLELVGLDLELVEFDPELVEFDLELVGLDLELEDVEPGLENGPGEFDCLGELRPGRLRNLELPLRESRRRLLSRASPQASRQNHQPQSDRSIHGGDDTRTLSTAALLASVKQNIFVHIFPVPQSCLD